MKSKTDRTVLVIGAIMIVLGFAALMTSMVLNAKILGQLSELKGSVESQKGELMQVSVRIDQMENWANQFSQAVVQGFQQIGMISSNSTAIGDE